MRIEFKRVALLALFLLPSCVHVSSDPIYFKGDINVNLKVDRQLDEFFAFENSTKPATTQSTSTTQPAASAAD